MLLESNQIEIIISKVLIQIFWTLGIMVVFFREQDQILKQRKFNQLEPVF